eukprot:COSAG01_NODE_2145_length_8304_cov_162.380256_10_plen_80_part_00
MGQVTVASLCPAGLSNFDTTMRAAPSRSPAVLARNRLDDEYNDKAHHRNQSLTIAAEADVIACSLTLASWKMALTIIEE